MMANAVAGWKYLVAFTLAALACTVEAQPQSQDLGSDIDPPVRVARMSYTSGRVSFSPAGSDEWVEALVNRPVVTGDRLWADNDSRAELAIDNSTWWIGDSTSLIVSNLDDRIAQMQVQEGVVEVNVRRLPAQNIVEIDTPNLAFSITRPGRYRVEVDPHDGATMVVVRDGSGEVYGEGASYVITTGQAYRFYGTDVRDSEFVSLPPLDGFDRFVLDRERRYARAPALRYVSPEVIGYEDLDAYGSWSVEPTYGNVWFPRVTQVGWAPYREGHWAWIEPWGWTWVDNEPWGFAPFHYGRWAHFSRGWGWVPGPRSVRAVYAPALVAFVGGAGFSLAVSSGPAIGWFPLAPREVYVPPYHVSRNYFRQVNVSNTVVNVTNVTNIYNNPGRVSELTYANRRAPNAVTAVPPAAFAQSRSVGRAAIPVPAAALQRAEVHPVAAVAPARPAFLGAAPAAQAKPPAATMRRPVVAKAPPPPPPVPDAQKVQALERNPGRPLTQQQVQTLRRAAPAEPTARAPVNVISQPKPAPNAAPPAREAGARRPTPAAAPGAPPVPPGQAERRAPGAPPTAAPPEAARPPAAERRAPSGPSAATPPEAARPPAAGPGAPAATRPPGAERRVPEAARPPAAEPGAPAAARPPAASARPAAEAGSPPQPRAAPERPPQAAQRPPEARPPQPQARPQRTQPPPDVRPPPQQRAPQPRPQPVEPRPQARPQPPSGPPEARPPQPQARPQPTQPPPDVRPPPQQRAPQARPQPVEPRPQARPQPPSRAPEARPQPQQRAPEPQRPVPQARPQPQPAPQAHPQPPPQARPQPQPAPEARPQPQPAPQAARRPESRGAPPAKDEKGNPRHEPNG